MSEQPPADLTPSPAPPPVKNLELKAGLLLLSLALVVIGAFVYVLYARGAFEAKQQLVLTADDSEGVLVGMDITFSGFPIGRVRRIELSKEGNARILVDVPHGDAHWLRKSSIFTLERGLLGNTRIRAYSGVLKDPPLEDGAERPLLVGDATAEIPKLVATARELLVQIKALTAQDAALAQTLGNLKTTTEKLNGPHGVLGVALGNEADAKKIVTLLEKSTALVARVDALTARMDGIAAKADTQVFGKDGLASGAKASVEQMSKLLEEARGSLKKVDAVLVEAQGIGANTRAATEDLGALRTEVEASLRRIDHLVTELNKKWPFKRESEIKLP
jgi:phospholipid/cholesterol/gamma-HCH transport system substrate-binding protein